MAKARHNQNVKASVHLKRILIYQVLFKIYVVLCISFVAYYRYFAELGRLQTKSRKKEDNFFNNREERRENRKTTNTNTAT